MRIALPPAISPSVLTGHDRSAPIVDLGGETMGTTWQLRFAAVPDVDPAQLRVAIAARLGTIIAEMSHWEAASLLSAFNRAPAGSWHRLPPDFAAVIAAALDIAEASGGAFDPTIGRIVAMRGFGPAPAVSPPDEAAVDRARADAGWHRLAYDRATRRLRQPGGVALDLSGIAKGYAVDAVAGLLEDFGIRHGLIEIGGELHGAGIRPDGDPWWVDLEDPPGAVLPPLRIALHGLAVATSGDYRRGAHTIDPRTGRSTAHGLTSVSVLHDRAMLADAWATALTVLGPDEGFALATERHLAARFLCRADGGISERITPALQAMIDG
jgi:thiamine biosynthesis lipoprotein